MLRRALLAALILLVCGTALPLASAQELPIDLDVDYASFLYDANETLLELYLSVGAASLEYVHDGEKYVASVPLTMTLRPVAASAPEGASTTPVFDEETTLQFAVTDTSALDDGLYFVEQFRTVTAPGEYSLDLVVPTDAALERPELRLSLDVTVPMYAPSDQAMVSGVTLSSGIQQAEEVEARFYKNGLVITPNPKGMYGEGQGRVFYYVEAYGLPAAVEAEQYTLLTYISESNLPRPIEAFQRRTTRVVRAPDVIVGAFDVSELPSGSYFLRFAFLNDNNEALAEQGKKFFVFNPGIERETVAMDEGFETSLYAVMSEEEVEDNLQHARVLATQQELSQLGRLRDIDAKREYLAAFWQRRDTDSDPSVNSARREFYERLRYAEERYATPFEPSWETGRG
ncbi:MAG: GWxTD domain-containing protein, partial [Rhodothermaceae bacterium]|nr:GWxTD domain-containing protein [Rhodothermaceae bacterium]